MNIIFEVTGGLGKNVMATAVAESLKKKYQDAKIIIVASHPAVWVGNPNIDRIFPIGNTPYFYEDYIKGKECKIFKSEPYHHEDFINKKKHMIQVQCEQFGLEYNNEQPYIYLNQAEKEHANMKFFSDKPILVVQTNGGGENSNKPISWTRDLPLKTAAEILNHLRSSYNILHLKLKNQPSLGIEGVQDFFAENPRDLISCISKADKILCIDSSVQHIAKALNKNAVVCWPVDNTKNLGYSSHKNIVSKLRIKNNCFVDSYLWDYNMGGELHEYPFENGELFNSTEILNYLV